MVLEGVVFCITGNSSVPRPELIELIKKSGGKHSQQVTKNVTHLICCSDYEETPKYKAGLKRECFLVNEDYIKDCIEKDDRLDEGDYHPTKVQHHTKRTKGELDRSEEEKDAERTKTDGEIDKENEDNEINSENEEKKDKKNLEKKNSQQTKNAQPKKTRSPKKKKQPVEKETNTLSGKVVALYGRFSIKKEEMVELIEKHGGSVSTSINKVTHFLVGNTDKSSTKHEKAIELGIPTIDEDYIRGLIEERESELSQSPKKGKDKIEKIVSRRIIRGEPHYIVKFVDWSDLHNAIWTRDQLIARFPKAKVNKFDRDLDEETVNAFAPKLSDRPKKSSTKKSPAKKIASKEITCKEVSCSKD